LENPIWIRLVALERGRRGLLQVAILELQDSKVQSYSRFKIELLKSRKSKMRKFDGKDLVNWILQMEQYFDLHGVPLLQNVCIASSYLELDQFLWYEGLFSCKQLVTWSIFTEEMIAQYKDTKSNTFFRATPQQLERVKGLCDIVESKIMETRKHTPHNYKYGSVVSPSFPQPTRVTPEQLEEKREKGLCYNCDNKCAKGHKCAEKKLFYIEYEEEEKKDQETSKEEDIRQEPTLEKEEMNHTISCKALARITTPQTLKIEENIKKKKVQEVKDHIEKEEMNPTISCNSLVKIATPLTIKIEGHIKKKNVQEVKDHIKHQKMNPTIACKGLEEITTPQTLEIEGHIKKKKVQAVKDHIEHQIWTIISTMFLVYLILIVGCSPTFHANYSNVGLVWSPLISVLQDSS